MKYLISLIALILFWGILSGFISGFLLLFNSTSLLIPLIIGFVFGTIFYFFVVKKFTEISTFEHELTHAVVALLFFRKVTNFTVTRYEGGYITHYGGFGGAFGDLNITLAPYFLPTFTFFLVLVRPFLPSGYLFPFDIFLGFTFGYHIFSTISEIKGNWHKESFKRALSYSYTKSDIAKSGYVFSFIYILTITLLLHGIIFWVLAKDFQGILNYGNIIWEETSKFLGFLGDLYMRFFDYVQELKGN